MTLLIDPSKWKIKLPVFHPPAVLDNSVIVEAGRCPRRYLYRYGLRRGGTGKSYPIQFGLAIHKYKEVTESLMIEAGDGELTDEIHNEGYNQATDGFEDPPLGHKYEYLSLHRLILTLMEYKERTRNEKRDGKIIVTRAEDSFDLELPFTYCNNCGMTDYDHYTPNTFCRQCKSEILVRARHGGRVDQFIKFVSLNNARMVKDFKSTSRMGKTYELKFDPNSQLQGYTWSGGELSGEKYSGALIETIYNTKNVGPLFFQTYVEFSKGQIIQWLASVMIEHQLIRSMWARVEELGYLAFPQRTDSCGDFGGCMYRDACKSSSGWEIEQWLENYTVYSHWDFTDPDKEESKV